MIEKFDSRDLQKEYDFDDQIKPHVERLCVPIGLPLSKGVSQVTTRLYERTKGRVTEVTEEMIVEEAGKYLAEKHD